MSEKPAGPKGEIAQEISVNDILSVHEDHPVRARHGRFITSAITSLDLHDLARSSRTYGVRAVYVVHPVAEQREFARSVIDHWRIGYGRSFDSRRVEALEQLREALNLESLPLRIECFDVSTAMGQDNVGSMVVFQDGLPKKAHYRKFGIRGQQGMDDFAAIGEVVSRRFARLSDGAAQDYDESFAATPNLVVIDGGKGQLAAALAAIHAYDLPRAAVIALAKRVEEVFVPGRAHAILPDRHHPGLQLLHAGPT